MYTYSSQPLGWWLMLLVYIPGTPLERISSSKEGNSQPPSSSTNSPLDELWQSIHCSYGTVHLLPLFCCWVDRKGPSKAHLVRAEIDDQYYVVLVPSSPLLQFYGPTVLFFPKCKERGNSYRDRHQLSADFQPGQDDWPYLLVEQGLNLARMFRNVQNTTVDVSIECWI